MNPIFQTAAESAELGWVMGGATIVFVLGFVAWTLWAWHPSNRAAMDAAARLPLDDGEIP